MKQLFILISILFYINAYAQDIIHMTSGKVIEAKILEINSEEISYKKQSYLDGPTYRFPMSEIASIEYPNGEVEYFNNTTQALPEENLPIIDIENYHGFLLAKGNAVYIPDRPTSYEQTAVEYLRELIQQDGYWTLATTMEQAHFIISYEVILKGNDYLNPVFILRRDKSLSDMDFNSTSLVSFFRSNGFFHTSESIDENLRVANKLFNNIQKIQKDCDHPGSKKWMKFFTKE